MTPQEAIEKLKGMQSADTEDIIGRLKNKYIGGKKYESVYDLSINALEKQIPMKPIEVFNSKLVHCEKCGNIIKSARRWCDKFCDHCGQAIDWESDNQ